MKLIKQLLINGKDTGLVSDEVKLELSSPGRARFIVQSDKPLSGAVQYAIGWSETRLFKLFVGYIENQITVNSKQQLIFCRELSAVLNRDLSLGLRHATLKDTLAAISKKTALPFVTPEQSYAVTPASHFHHVGGGYQAMDSIGPVYQIPNYIWQQQGDASIYVGSWQHSRWASRPVQIPDRFFTEHLAFNSAKLLMAPSLRPGVKFNRGIIDTLTSSKEHMVISWKPLNALS